MFFPTAILMSIIYLTIASKCTNSTNNSAVKGVVIRCQNLQDYYDLTKDIKKNSSETSLINLFIESQNETFQINLLDGVAKSLRTLHITAERKVDILNNDTIKFSQLVELFMKNLNPTDSRFLDKVDFPCLKNLTLRSLGLKNIPFSVLRNAKNLVSLDLSDNKIGGIVNNKSECVLLEKLENLNLHKNFIERVSFNNCGKFEKLKYLNLSNNVIENKYFTVDKSMFANPFEDQCHLAKKFPQLENLNLTHNKLTMLNGNTFMELRNLEWLDLSHNNLESISINATGRKKINDRLKYLYLSNNNLTRIRVVDRLLEGFSVISNISFNNNQWHCDCNFVTFMLEIKKKKNDRQLNIQNIYDITCFSSSKNNQFKGIPIAIIDTKEICSTNSSSVLYTSIIITSFTILIGIFIACYTSCLKSLLPYLINKLKPEEDDTTDREYDAIIVHHASEAVTEEVRSILYNHLSVKYNIAMHQQVFDVGYIEERLHGMVKRSRRMIVYANSEFTTDYKCKRLLNKGLQEEFNTQGFKVLAVVHPSLQNELSKDLYEVVEKRPFVHKDDKCCIEEIMKFLPQY